MSLSSSDTKIKPIGPGPLGKLRTLFRRTAARPGISFLIPFLVVIVGRMALLGQIPPPQPLIEDEFSYLLAADTYASFRVTNPPHPLWVHFETIHELMQPTYMSKYPPMQGLILAFGQLVFGIPWAGVLISMAVFCGLLPWAFRAWVPCDWALMGALLATCKIGIMSYWTESYWGGGAAAIGGALVLGSVGRLGLQPTPGMAALFTLGAGILANSRPFEGMVFLAGNAGYLLWRWMGKGRWRVTWPGYPLRVAPSACLIAFPILLAMGYSNYRVTGSITELPYQAFEKQYSIWTPFIWQQTPTAAPVYRHEFIRRDWIDWEAAHKVYERKYWRSDYWLNFLMLVRFYFGAAFYLGGFLFIPALLFGGKNRSILGLLIFYCGLTRISMQDINPHYTAPAAALIYLGVAAALRTSWYFSPLGMPLGKLLVISVLSLFLIFTAATRTDSDNRFLWDKTHFIEKRNKVLSFLNAQPGRQLIFVHQGGQNDPNQIWIFNRADIDSSRIIWADDMGPEENQKVLDYYNSQHRTVWELDDDAELTLRPYGDPAADPLIRIKNPPPPAPLPQ